MEIQFALPPGLYHSGTVRQSAGRWYAGNLVRWTGGVLRPIYGWQAHSSSAVTGSARAMVTWRDNSNNSWIGVGTHNHLYVMDRAGGLYDITPSGLTAGRADASFATGYGGSTYGTGTYGGPRPDTTNILDATVWSLDTWGQNLVGCNPDDTFIYQWVAPTTGTIAAKVTNAPTADALVVTSERFLFAMGTTDHRTVSWCDQQNLTTWTPAVTNQAGSFPLQTFGRLMCGKRLSTGTGLWTDTDLWLAQYIGGTLVYGFTKAGNGCGTISRQSVIVNNAQAAWMGPQGFFLYNGSVSPLECDVQDAVFANLNRAQASKIYGVLNSQFGECWWFYPSAGSTEIDSCVSWNYVDNIWMLHSFGRTCGADAGGAFTFPLAVDPATNTVLEHETGFSYGGATPYVESGPLEFAPLTQSYTGQGAKIWQASRFIPDELIEGQVNATFKAQYYPNGPEYSFGPYTLKPSTDVRFSARQVRLRLTGVGGSDWRFGKGRLEVAGSSDR